MGSTPNISELICIFLLSEVDSVALSDAVLSSISTISLNLSLSLLNPAIIAVPTEAIAIPTGPATAPPIIPPRVELPSIPPTILPVAKPPMPFPSLPILPNTPPIPSVTKCGERAKFNGDVALPKDSQRGCSLPPFAANLSILFCQSVRLFIDSANLRSLSASLDSIFCCCIFNESSAFCSIKRLADASFSAI